MLGPSCKCIAVVHALLFTSVTATSSSTALNCLPGYYFDGKGCTKCTQCPLGYGLKNLCSDTEDTQCQPCIKGYDYSDTIGLDECILCDTYSKCLPGQSKMIKKCTVSSPPECDGCEDGYYIDDEVNGCTRCSSPCRTDEEEVQKCLTKHDRICKPRSTRTDALSTASSTPATSTLSTSVNNSKDRVLSLSTTHQQTAPTKTDAEIDKSSGEVPTAESSSRAQGTLSKYLKLWIPVGAVVAIVIAIAITAFVYKVTRARRRKPNDDGDPNRTNTLELAEIQAFVRKGLDRFVKDLEIDEKKSIIEEISGSRCGFADWRVVLEKLEDPKLIKASRAWRALDEAINIQKFLEEYGEKEGSTVRRLIQAIRDAGLGRAANKLEQNLDPDRGGGSGDSVEIAEVENLWV